jgi:RimJ/RimL family protein N-acetyltransferase
VSGSGPSPLPYAAPIDQPGAMTVSHAYTRVDGGPLEIRELAAADFADVLRLHDDASERSLRLRFFSTSRHNAHEYVSHLMRAPDPSHGAVVALVDGHVVGTAAYELVSPGAAEIAVLVADRWQHDGVGTLMLRELAVAARASGLRTFVADVLADNGDMIHLMQHLGLPVTMQAESGVVRVTCDLAGLDG